MNCTLILMRHGHADDNGTLTSKGEEQAQSTAMQMIKAGIQPDLILHSPISRAARTAATVADSYKSAGQPIAAMRVEQILRNEPEEMEKALTCLTNEKIVLIVSHEPQIRYALETLTQQPWRPHHATAALVENAGDGWSSILNPGSGRFVRVYQPR